jgi:hypothetical protein
MRSKRRDRREKLTIQQTRATATSTGTAGPPVTMTTDATGLR